MPWATEGVVSYSTRMRWRSGEMSAFLSFDNAKDDLNT
jgi:hypothetical protein